MDPVIYVQNKNFSWNTKELAKVLGPDRKPKVIYTDNSLEFGKSCEDLSWNHCASTPHRSETNGIAKRAVRSVKEGTSAVLLQSGLNQSWWADSMECYTYLRNIQDLLSDGKTPCERRFGMPFNGPYCLEQWSNITLFLQKTNLDCISLEQKSFQVFSRLCIVRGGENLERRRYGRRHWRIGGDGRIRTPRQKAQCKGSVNAPKKWKLHIPSRRWNSQNLWVRTASENIHLNPGAFGTRRRTRNPSRKIRWISFSNPTSRRLDAGMMRKLKWLLDDHRRIHLSSSCCTPSQNVHVERRIMSHSVKYIDVTRTTHTSLDVMLEKTDCTLLEWMEKKNCQMRGQDSQDLFF